MRHNLDREKVSSLRDKLHEANNGEPVGGYLSGNVEADKIHVDDVYIPEFSQQPGTFSSREEKDRCSQVRVQSALNTLRASGSTPVGFAFYTGCRSLDLGSLIIPEIVNRLQKPNLVDDAFREVADFHGIKGPFLVVNKEGLYKIFTDQT